jgi:hypothetical protein
VPFFTSEEKEIRCHNRAQHSSRFIRNSVSQGAYETTT